MRQGGPSRPTGACPALHACLPSACSPGEALAQRHGALHAGGPPAHRGQGRTWLPRFPPPHNGRSIPTEPAEHRDNRYLPRPRPRPRITKTDPVVTPPPPQVWGRSSSFLVGSCLPRWPRTRSPGLHTLSPHSGPDQSGRLCPATPAHPPTVLSFCYYPMGSRTFISRLTP